MQPRPSLKQPKLEHLQQSMLSQNIENILHCSCSICSCSCSNSLAISRIFFLLMNSSSSNLMSYCTLAIEFLALKYYTNSLFYQFFLSHPDFFFSLIPSVASFFFSPLILSFSPLQLLLFFS